MVAMEAKYHAAWQDTITKLPKKSQDTNDMVCQSLAFVKLVSYIEDVHEVKEIVLLLPRSAGAGTDM